MLSERRQKYVTASQAHRVMAGFELELSDRGMERPNVDESLFNIILTTMKKPLVRDVKDLGVTGKDIDVVYKYIKATTPTFSDGMLSVALEIAMSEFISERDPGPSTPDMERGIEQEGEAMAALAEKVGVSFENTLDDQLFFTEGNLGVTPDGVEFDDDYEVVSCAEVKNPKDKTHMKYLYLIRDQASLLKHCPIYYWQAQTGLEVTHSETYHWASYHNHFKEPFNLLYIPIARNEEHIEILKERAGRVMDKVPVVVDAIKTIWG